MTHDLSMYMPRYLQGLVWIEQKKTLPAVLSAGGSFFRALSDQTENRAGQPKAVMAHLDGQF
jgi:hypothetical protein